MKIFSEVIGNMTTDPQWAEKLKNTKIEYLELDQWTAQKSRFIAKGSDGQEYAVALKRHSQIENGDILEYDPERKVAIVIRIALQRKHLKRLFVVVSNLGMPLVTNIGRLS